MDTVSKFSRVNRQSITSGCDRDAFEPWYSRRMSVASTANDQRFFRLTTISATTINKKSTPSCLSPRQSWIKRQTTRFMFNWQQPKVDHASLEQRSCEKISSRHRWHRIPRMYHLSEITADHNNYKLRNRLSTSRTERVMQQTPLQEHKRLAARLITPVRGLTLY